MSGTTTVQVPARFNGPPTSANGGYACGVVGAGRGGAWQVRLSAPPPLDRDLALHETEAGVELRDGDSLVASGRPADPPTARPAPDPDQVREVAAAFDHAQYAAHHWYPGCFVCGPAREPGDGLRLFPGLLPEDGMCAWPWTPAPGLGTDGVVDERVVWAAMDCPSIGSTLVLAGEARPVVLGSFTAVVHEPVPVGEEVVVGGWPDGEEGRKQYAGSAVWSADGRLLAAARATWVRLTDDQLRAFGVVGA